MMDEPVITQTVRELLSQHAQEMREGFTKIDTRLNSMATKADVDVIHTRIDKVEGRVADIEDTRIKDKAVNDFKQMLIQRSGWLVAGVVVPIGAVLLYGVKW
jgi:hypothetical protein